MKKTMAVMMFTVLCCAQQPEPQIPSDLQFKIRSLEGELNLLQAQARALQVQLAPLYKTLRQICGNTLAPSRDREDPFGAYICTKPERAQAVQQPAPNKEAEAVRARELDAVREKDRQARLAEKARDQKVRETQQKKKQ